MPSHLKLKRVPKGHNLFVGYTPLPDEIDWKDIPFLKSEAKKTIILPQDKNADPIAIAETLATHYENVSVRVLIPGTKFDTKGTRRGRGGGWYDRFLSRIPSTWVRVGISDTSKLSLAPLERKSWDEPVDWIIIRDGFLWNIHETRARK